MYSNMTGCTVPSVFPWQTCQILVQIRPCSSHSLYLLGNTQLTIYNNDPDAGDPAERTLSEAKGCFQASIKLEGKPAAGEMPAEIKGGTMNDICILRALYDIH